MLQKCIPVLLLFLLLDSFARINCEENTRMPVGCISLPELFIHEHFEIKYYFSTRKQKYQLFTPEIFDSGKIDFDPTRRIVIVVHGLAPSIYIEKMYDLVDALLEWGDVNVIYVDWEKGCPSPVLYQQSSINTEYAAVSIKEFVQYFIKKWEGTNMSVEHWGPLHFIGLSIGAHVAGQAAEFLKQEDQLFVDRITGLEPAEPCFENANSPLILRKWNARFVDIIHTDVARTVDGGLGLIQPMGHADFYVNGGSNQPGCSWFSADLNFFLLIRLGLHLVLDRGRCNHLRSVDIFSASLKQTVLKQCTFWAHPWKFEGIINNAPFQGEEKCDKIKCVEMGINAELYNYSANVSNVYYVPSTDAPPYCLT